MSLLVHMMMMLLIIVILQRAIINMMEFTRSGFYFRALSVLDLRVFLHLNFQNSLCSSFMLLLLTACISNKWVICRLDYNLAMNIYLFYVFTKYKLLRLKKFHCHLPHELDVSIKLMTL